MPRNFINARTAVFNTKRKFGAALAYIPAIVVLHGREQGALFTEDQLLEAVRRGKLNPEELPKVELTRWEKVKRWWAEMGPSSTRNRRATLL